MLHLSTCLETRPKSPFWRNDLPVEAPIRPVARSLFQEEGFPARPLGGDTRRPYLLFCLPLCLSRLLVTALSRATSSVS
jgi:hypothetical protein